MQKILDTPFDGFFGLRAVLGQALRKISFAIKQRNRDHRQAKISSSADGVSRKDTQSAAVGRHGILKRNLHGEIRNQSIFNALHSIPSSALED